MFAEVSEPGGDAQPTRCKKRANSRLERAYERWPLLAAVHRAVKAVTPTRAAEPGRPASAQSAASMWEE